MVSRSLWENGADVHWGGEDIRRRTFEREGQELRLEHVKF